jgi:type II secretory pathway pseudopilin PulG
MRIDSILKPCKVRLRLVSPGRMRGFTFIGLLVIVTIMGIALLAVGEVWNFAQKREKEQALLFTGGQFRQAIKLYYMHTPASAKLQPYPMSLEDLLKDPRYPSTQRYLRKIYLDPFTNSPEWGLLKNPNGGIYGVYSLSAETPAKKENFKLADKSFEGKTKYSEWAFSYSPNINSGIQPGNQLGNQFGSQPGNQPGSQFGNQFGNQIVKH